MKRSNILPLVLVFCFASTQAQQPKPTPPPPPTLTTGGQKPGEVDQDIIKITTNLVQIDAVVTKGGKQITDLNADDFEIFEDGKPQAITNFSYISNVVATSGTKVAAAKSNLPSPPIPAAVRPDETRRTIAFVIDDLGMAFQSLDIARNQLRKFINEQLSENDLVAIVRTSGEIGALQQFTTDRRILLSAIDHIKWQPCSRAGATTFGYNDRSCSGDAYSASLRAIRYVVTGMGSLPGRKSLVVLSDNVPLDRQESSLSPESGAKPIPAGAGAEPVTVPTIDTGGTRSSGVNAINDPHANYEAQLKHIAELAIRGSVVIYTVDTRGLEVTFPGADVHFSGAAQGRGSVSRQVGQAISTNSGHLFNDRQGAELMAKETGGFLIADSNDFGFKRVYEDQQGYYLIGFRPSDETFDQKFHNISVRVKKSGLVVRTRKGFYGVTDDEARATLRKAPTTVNEALRSPFGANQITIRLNSIFTNASDAGSLLKASIFVNAGDLSFTESGSGLHNAAFDVDSVLYGDNGEILYMRSQTATLQLNPTQYAQTLREGVAYGFDVPVKYAGGSQFRVAVRDHASGHLGTAGQVVVIPDLRKNQLALSGILLTAEPHGQSANIAAEIQSATALRLFHQGDDLIFGYAIYKAQTNGGRPQITSQTRIFRDGKLFYSGQNVPINLEGQPDLQRITSGSRLRLGPDFPAGDYILQIVVTDNLAREKQRVAAQWIDFEVIK